MAEMGRPKIEIDWDQFDKLCGLQCTAVEIAEWFGCSVDTIERRLSDEHGLTFAEYYKKRSAKGKISLRRKQFEVALAGNVSMLIWLGKQYLEQKDRQDDDSRESTQQPQMILTAEAAVALLQAARGDKT